MEEILKTVKRIHYLLLAFNIAVFSFLLSSENSDQYLRAIEELEIVKSLNLGNHESYSKRIIEKILTEYHFMEEVNEVARETEKAAIGSTFSLSSIIPYTTDKDQSERLTFLKNQTFMVFLPDKDELKSLIRNFFQRGKIFYKKERSTTNMLYLGPLSTASIDGGLTVKTKGVTVYGSISDKDDNMGLQINGNLRGSVITLSDNYLVEILKKNKEYKQLTAPSNGNILFLPDLSVLWDDIKYKTIDDAFTLLQKKHQSRQGKITFGGISINQEWILIFAPLVILFFSIFLLSHVLHMKSRASSHLEEISMFPWVVLFDNRVSLVFTIGTLVVCPVVANFLVLLKFFSMSYTWILSAFFALGAIHPLVLILKKIFAIREMIRGFNASL